MDERMAPYKLELIGISKRFGETVANDNLTVRVRGGNIHSVIGENGAGKSTLMNILSGNVQPDGGTIRIDGTACFFPSPREASLRGIGMVHQELMLIPELTVWENIILGWEDAPRGWLHSGRIGARLRSLLDEYDISVPLDVRVQTLPLSVRQKIEIVKVLYRGADILILDEPTSVLTPIEARGLFQALRQLKARGKTILFVSHKLPEVMEISDAITVMRHGQVVGETTPQATTPEILSQLIVGSQIVEPQRHGESPSASVVFAATDLTVRRAGSTQPAVDRVSLKLMRGEILGVAGIAGNGQNELCEAIVGLRPLLSGQIRLHDRDITSLTTRQRRDLGLAYIPQERLGVALAPHLASWRNGIAGRQWHAEFGGAFWMDLVAATRQVRSIVADYSVVAPARPFLPLELSGGNQQKFVVGRELEGRLDVLIAEDPTRGIDIGSAAFIRRKLLDFASNGGSVLLVSTDLTELRSIADSIAVMFQGRIVASVDPARTSEEQLGLYMMGLNAR